MPAPPGLAEALLIALRWLHGLAAILFLGWSAVLWLDGPTYPNPAQARQRFKEITETSLLVFLASGAILTFDRLSSGAGSLYAALLVVKVLAGVIAYQYAFRWRRMGLPVRGIDGRILLLSGAATVLLAAVLQALFEGGVRGAG